MAANDNITSTVAAIYSQQTLSRALLLFFTLLSSLLVYVLYEMRAPIVATMLGTPLAIFSMIAGFVFLVIAIISWAFLTQLEKKTDQTIMELRERIVALEQHLLEERVNCDKRIAEVREMASLALTALSVKELEK